MTGLLYHPLFEKHLENYTHVERPERIKAIMQKIKSGPLADKLKFIEAQPAEPDWIARVHDRDYLNAILSLEVEDAVVLDWGDTVATAATPQAALHAAGAGVQAARMVLDKKLTSAFCAVRPPGHHAEADRAMGFCIFNNVAIAAADLLDTGGLSRVAILDWDIHHGNGTERMFDDNPRVLYISLHQYPHYPGTGHAGAVGVGAGTGYTLNIPMGSGAGDDDYREAFAEQVIPAVDDFEPEFVLISAGFDGHIDDPLSGTRLSTAMFAEMTQSIKQAAERHCRGRIVSLLEGGYDLSALADSVEAHLKVLIG
jgi:acetoin utilization deacetylase AcuC-like enzyme